MKLDDTHPDYFVDDSDEKPDEGRTINFSAEEGSAASADVPENAGPKPRKRRWKWITGVLLVLIAAVCGWVWFQFYNPFVEDARMKCYVINVEKRGVLFKTFEADLLTEKSLTDSARVYSEKISVSVPDAALARQLQDLQGTGKLVDLSYETFKGAVPWRGASKTVVTGFSK